jgi:hypothetical protein
MEGIKRSRLICIQVLSDVLPLKVVPTRVTMVANICALEYLLYFLRVLLLERGFMHVKTNICSFKMSKYVSTLEKQLTHKFLPRKVL